LNQSSARMDATFEQWTRLTDAYAKQFFLLQRGVRSARTEAMRLAQELQRLNQAMQSGA
jgi:putative heme degradation protein